MNIRVEEAIDAGARKAADFARERNMTNLSSQVVEVFLVEFCRGAYGAFPTTRQIAEGMQRARGLAGIVSVGTFSNSQANRYLNILVGQGRLVRLWPGRYALAGGVWERENAFAVRP